VFNDFESNMAVRITKLGNPTQKTAEIQDTAQPTVGSLISTLPPEIRKSDL